MPINYREILEVVSEFARHENIQVTIKQSAKAAAICGIFSFVGGVLLGPRGLAIGGVAGSAVAYNMAKGTYRSLVDVIANDLSETQKKRLAERVINAVQDVHPTDIVALLPLILNNADIKLQVIKAVDNFVSKETSLQIIE